MVSICEWVQEKGPYGANQKNLVSYANKSYNLSQLSAKILEGKTFDVQRNWQLNWAVFSKTVELEIEKT